MYYSNPLRVIYESVYSDLNYDRLFQSSIDTLLDEGYDLSDYTMEELYETFLEEQSSILYYLLEEGYAPTIRNAKRMFDGMSEEWIYGILEAKGINRLMSVAGGRHPTGISAQFSVDRTGDSEGNKKRRADTKGVLRALAKKGLGYSTTQGTYQETGQSTPTKEKSYLLAPKPGSPYADPARLKRVVTSLARRANQDSSLFNTSQGSTATERSGSSYNIGTIRPGRNPNPEYGETSTRPKREIPKSKLKKGQRQPAPQRSFHFY